MAAPDALLALLADKETWSQFRQQVPGTIDLTAATLDEVDLSGRDLSDCDLTGAMLNGACLDDCTLHRTNLNGGDLSFASLVGCQIIQCTAKSTRLCGAVLRRVALSETVFEDCDLSNSGLLDSKVSACSFLESNHKGWRVANISISRTKIVGADLDGACLEDLEADSCRIGRLSAKNATLAGLRLKNCELDLVDLAQSNFRQSAIIYSRIHSLRLIDSFVANLDFSYSILYSIDLAGVSLSSATMLETTFVDCRFPSQTGKIGWSGNYSPSPNLMRQPVQDTKGLPARLRRDIADAQYLRETHENAGDLVSRMGLRLWGVTCGFGTSLTRLTAFTLVGCTGIALIGTAIELASPTVRSDYTGLGMQMFWASLSAVFGVTETSSTNPTTAQAFVGALARVFGFFVLGLWVGLAANRLGKLSSQ